MAPISFAPPVIRAAIASLQAGLPGAIATFNAEAANTVDLDAPATASYRFGVEDAMSSYSFPFVEVAVGDGQFGQWSVKHSSGGQHVDHDLNLTTVLWQEAGDGETSDAYQRALGYIRVILEVLQPDGAFGPEVSLSNDPGGVLWRADIIPADQTSQDRVVPKWRVPSIVIFKLETVERFG